MTDLAALKAAFDRAGDLLKRAEDEVAAGGALDLVEFNEVLAGACAHAVRVKSEHFPEVRSLLGGILARLERLRTDCETPTAAGGAAS